MVVVGGYAASLLLLPTARSRFDALVVVAAVLRQALGLLLRYLPPAAAYAAMPEVLHLGIALRGAGLLLRNPLRMR